MEMIAGAGLMLGCVWALVRFSAARKVALWLVAAVVAIGGAIYAYNEVDQRRQRSRVEVSEVELRGLKLFGSGPNYEVKGEVKNNSVWNVRRVELVVTATDCRDIPGGGMSCDNIGEDSVSGFVGAPPGGLRAFSALVFFSSMPEVKGTFIWSYRVKAVIAD